jgi:DNA-directed RNA polymerase subunit K/omega
MITSVDQAILEINIEKTTSVGQAILEINIEKTTSVGQAILEIALGTPPIEPIQLYPLISLINT